MSAQEAGLTRRAFLGAAGLAAAGGAALAAGTLANRTTNPRVDPSVVARIPGEIIGPSAAKGHALRDPSRAPWAGKAPVSTERVRTAIVGSGIAGLCAAWMLDRSGWDDYAVLELEPSAGGTSTWGRYPASGCPWGAHYLPLPTRESPGVRRLLEDLGVITGWTPTGEPVYEETFLCQAPQERLHIHARWQEGLWPGLAATTNDTAQLVAFQDLLEKWRTRRCRDGRRPFALPVAASSTDAEVRALDGMSMADWLRREGLTSRRLRWYAEYATRDDFGCTLEQTSAWAGIHYFASRSDRARTIAERCSDGDPVLTWPEGNGWLARQMRDRVGSARVRTDALVFHVDVGEREVTVDWYDGAAVRRIVCEGVVLAVPRFVAVRICPAYATLAGAAAEAFTYAPWVVSNIEVSQLPANSRPVDAPIAWDNVIYDSDSLGYVVATHQSLATVTGASVLTHYQSLCRTTPRAARAAALSRPWSEWRDHVLADLTRPHPGIESSVHRLDVMVWGHGMIRPTPGFVWGPDRTAAAIAPRRAAVAHTDLSGLALFEEAHYHGVRAAEKLMGEAGHRFESLL